MEPAEIINCQGHRVSLAYSPEYSIHQIRIMEDSHRRVAEEVISAFFQSPMTIKAVIVEGESAVKPELKAKTAPKPVPEQTEPKPKADSKGASSAEEAMDMFGGKFIDED